MGAELTLDDVSRVIRLVREVCDRWDEPSRWRRHLLEGACTLIGGTAGMMLTEYDGTPGCFGNLEVVAVVGLPPPMRALVGPAVSEMALRRYEDVSRDVLPGMNELYERISRQGWATATRSELADERAYRAAPYYRNFRRRVDCDDYVVSIRVVDVPRRPEAINIDRPHGAPPFGPREVALLRLLHDEVAPLVGVRLATEHHLCRDGLSRRLNETLSLLLEGFSEKQAAAAMELGARTVHEYVTALYRHFDVSSRGELLAYFVRRQPLLRAVSNVSAGAATKDRSGTRHAAAGRHPRGAGKGERCPITRSNDTHAAKRIGSYPSS